MFIADIDSTMKVGDARITHISVSVSVATSESILLLVQLLF